MKWYYLSEENNVIGPVSDAALRELKECGEIKNETRICLEGTEDWITSEEIQDPAMAPADMTELIKFNCPHCSQQIEAKAAHVGMEAQCPACDGKVVVAQFSATNSGKIKVINPARPKVLIISLLGLAGILAIGCFVLLNKSRSSLMPSAKESRMPSANENRIPSEKESHMTSAKEYRFSAGQLPNLSRPVPEGFVLIPEGLFTMGDSLDGMEDAPPHEVYLSAFYMGRHEVTRGLWKRVIKWGQENNYQGLPKGWNDDELHGEGKDTLDKDDYPAYWMFWYDAVKWCNAYSEMEGLRPCYLLGGKIIRGSTHLESKNEFLITCDFSSNGYRLPTEAEWEKAARGGQSGLRYPWGDTINQTRARYGANGNHEHLPVGKFSPNGFGLYDMIGNVSERCWDCYDSDFYRNSPKWDSYDQNYFRDSTKLNPVGPPVQVANWNNDAWRSRVSRGGSADNNAYGCRVAYRIWDTSNLVYGFRLVCR